MWAHIDIAGVMESHGELPYLAKGMTGEFSILDHLLNIVFSHKDSCIDRKGGRERKKERKRE